ncbi:MAG: hypothetical protein WCR58_11325 [Bacteroidales bacterium]|nr:hypothetical protein [Bacteroidales bacterium]MDD3701186.1 hypothetical protein [Bacteroidales bacterium]MDY0368633.1 hypothetical protein [Bacteroidales bacterium]
MHQNSILLLFFFLMGIALIVFTYIFFSSKKADQGMSNPLKKRFWFFLILVFILGIFASVTIPKSPYFAHAGETPAKVVHVAAAQFIFYMSEQAIDPAKPSGHPIELPANEVVEFRVTSLDVNHGFAIYDETGRLITQTQAMPGYVNRLRYKFDQPGKYHVLCLEYCGIAHQIMRTSFTVN